ncbi:hypothetical protein [Reticulibacter mediterranei]|uniref:hypothetical protein n=1 Tax=Reticulibacter mediterranei TaxID=2778369 RepID=UPI001C68808D|nr:hypothetical protein [Reticulibacter mediterranei]
MAYRSGATTLRLSDLLYQADPGVPLPAEQCHCISTSKYTPDQSPGVLADRGQRLLEPP